MKKNTISISQLTQEILLNKKKNYIFESVAGQLGSVKKTIFALGNELKQDGLDPTEEETQAALLLAAIKNKGNIGSIDSEDVQQAKAQIKESRDYILESGSIALTVVEAMSIALGNAALIHLIAEIVHQVTGKKQDEEKIKQNTKDAIKRIKELSGWPAKVMEKFFSHVAKSWGGGQLAQEIAGITGTLFAVVVLFTLGILLFPSTGSIILIAISVTGLLGKLGEIWTLLKKLWTILTKNKEAVESKNKEEAKSEADQALQKAMGTMSRNAIMYK